MKPVTRKKRRKTPKVLVPEFGTVRRERCPHCGGTGVILARYSKKRVRPVHCPVCYGTGVAAREAS